MSGNLGDNVTEWSDDTDPRPVRRGLDPFVAGLGMSALMMGLAGSSFRVERSKTQPKPKRNPKASKQKAQKAARKRRRK